MYCLLAWIWIRKDARYTILPPTPRSTTTKLPKPSYYSGPFPRSPRRPNATDPNTPTQSPQLFVELLDLGVEVIHEQVALGFVSGREEVVLDGPHFGGENDILDLFEGGQPVLLA